MWDQLRDLVFNGFLKTMQSINRFQKNWLGKARICTYRTLPASIAFGSSIMGTPSPKNVVPSSRSTCNQVVEIWFNEQVILILNKVPSDLTHGNI